MGSSRLSHDDFLKIRIRHDCSFNTNHWISLELNHADSRWTQRLWRRTSEDNPIPCGHFSGGRGSWMRLHRLGYGAKEKTMNIREARLSELE